IYQDYLYNQVENVGNYRNLRLTQINADLDLMQGVESLVFPAAASARGGGPLLARGDENTRSNVRLGEENLSPLALNPEENVLLIGDLSFLSPPYHRWGDNDRFLSNLADWLGSDGRAWEIGDYPHFYHEQVDLVVIAESPMEAKLIEQGSALLNSFEAAGIEYRLTREVKPGRAAFALAPFEARNLFAAALDAHGAAIEETEDGGVVSVEGLGEFALDGSGLILFHEDEGAAQVYILGKDMDALQELAGRVIYQDYDGCAAYEQATLCAMRNGGGFDGESSDEVGGGQDEAAATGASVLLISVDDGSSGVDSGADEIAAAVSGIYDLTTWSVSEMGAPTEEGLAEYDVIIVATGDTTGSASGVDWLTLLERSGESFWLTGEQPLDAALYEIPLAEVYDIQIADLSHPVGAGFTDGEVIVLSDSLSGAAALSLTAPEAGQVVFTRGPASPEAGAPSVIASEIDGQRIILAAFSFYRLPVAAQGLFAYNVLAWLLGN
ncbi:MAG: hypothetical protein L0Z70_01075, partial [Chloroflexi bacterium]|nr:hypothetical protein [Chloroflexota bacterium]